MLRCRWTSTTVLIPKTLAAIRSATSVASHYMDLPDVGAVEAGRFGDLIAVRGNPLDDMEAMKTVDVVIKGGPLFKNE